MKTLDKWLHVILMRFNPVMYSVMILVFLGAHYAVYLRFSRQEAVLNFSDVLYTTPLFLALLIVFFRLRLFDEVKDVESDCIHHPERPLPQGIVGKDEIIRIVFFLIIFEIAIFSLYGFWALTMATITVLYSIVMFKEFFLSRFLRSHLTLYAVTHTIIVVFISIVVFAALFAKPFMELPLNIWYFACANWFLFNIFEFGRKTFAPQEEKGGVDSYSKIYGKFGAVLLVLVMATLQILFMKQVTVLSAIINILFLLLVILGIVGFLYAMSDRVNFAYTYRTITSLYIVLTYGVIVTSLVF